MPTTDELIEAFLIHWCDTYPMDVPMMKAELLVIVESARADALTEPSRPALPEAADLR